VCENDLNFKAQSLINTGCLGARNLGYVKTRIATNS